MNPHSVSLFLGVRGRDQREQHRERDRHVALRWRACVDVPDRIGQLLPHVLPRIGVEKLLVVVDLARDHVEVEALGGARLAIHEERQALGACIAQPFVDGEAVALRLGDLLALLVEEELVVESLERRRSRAPLADLAGELHRVDRVLAGHLVVDAERRQRIAQSAFHWHLDAAAGDNRRLDLLVGIRIDNTSPCPPRRCRRSIAHLHSTLPLRSLIGRNGHE